MKTNYFRVFFNQDDGLGGGSEEINDVTSEVTVENNEDTTDASQTQETETDQDLEETDPGSIEDQKDAEAIKAAKAEQEKAAGAGKAATPAFTPNFKVKAYGKEFEIPEKFRSMMTDADSEKEIRDIFEKAYAVEAYKPKQEQMRQKVEHYEKEVIPAYQQQDKIINECIHYLKNNDFESYFETLGIDVGRVMRWMDQRLSFTPEQLALYNQNRALQKNVYQQGLENSLLKNSQEQTQEATQQAQTEHHLNELGFMLEKPEYSQTLKEYDAKNGEGSLRMLVLKHGAYAAQVEGRNLSKEEAIKEVIERLSPVTVTQPHSPQAKTVTPKDKPVLPAVKPRPVSPAVKQPNSIADIRKKAEAMGASRFDE